MTPRNLRLLVIDDKPRNLVGSIGNLDCVEVPQYDVPNGGSTYISTSVQMFEVLSECKGISVDLLCIDVKFHNDTTDFPYPGEMVHGRSEEDHPNPMGLLFGVVAAAMYANRDFPFSFAVYSGGASLLKNDSVAVNCFGMLKAIEGHKFTRPKGEVRDEISEMIAEMPSTGISGITSQLLRGYRDRLRDFVATMGGVDCDDNLSVLIELAKACKTAANCRELRERGLEIQFGDRIDSIRLGSLFADCATFSVSDVQNIVSNELELLKETFIEGHDSLYSYTLDAMMRLEETKLSRGECLGKRATGPFLASIDAALSEGKTPRKPIRDDLIFSVLICTLVEAWKRGFFAGEHDQGRLRLSILDEFLGGADQTTIDRQLKRISKKAELPDIATTLGELIQQIKTLLPTPVRIRRCAQRYANQIAGLSGDRLPPFLQPNIKEMCSFGSP